MKKVNYALGLLAFAAVTSCTDNTYDLSKDNMDWSMQAGGSDDVLWMPDGNTSDAKLKDLFSVSEGQNLKFIKDPETGRDGLYCMQGEGEQNATVSILAGGSADWTPDVDIDELSTTVGLGDIPEFLRREQTCFDIMNPIILIKVDKQPNVDFKAVIKMTNVKDGAETMSAETDGIDKFVIEGDCSGDNAKKFYIAAEPLGTTQEEVDKYLPEEYQGATWVPLKGTLSTLQEMLRQMPDEFKIELKEGEPTDPDHYQGKGAGSADIKLEYLFYAPMRPDNLFRLNDDDRADGFQSDLKDMLFDALLVKADVTGDLPMHVRIVPVAINEKGEAMSEVKVTINERAFLEVPGDEVTSILVKLTSATGEKVSHYIKRDVNYFDGIRFDFTMLKPTEPGVKIFSDMKVRLDHMKIGAQGVGYDGN